MGGREGEAPAEPQPRRGDKNVAVGVSPRKTNNRESSEPRWGATSFQW